ncbi:MAG TPA: alpha/beta fold hydrolase [Kofleriaceae bacterium]|nr:alpha/beta fold hydrolase [Kofleriaceae bacterium]
MQHAIAVVVALLCVQLLAGAALLSWRWARSARPRPRLPPQPQPQPPPQPPPQPQPQPHGPIATRPAVMLVHGFMGFGSFGLGRARIHYFRRVARHLERRGVEVHVATLPPLGSTPDRADALVAQLARVKSRDIVIFAHSLGGLDARWALARGGADRVRALVTIGTPHRGSPIADAFARGPAASLRRALERVGLGSAAVDWLTTERLTRFNEEIADVPGVRYACVIGASADRRKIHPLLRVTHAFLRAHGPNDGLVTAASQTWGEVITEAELDHWAQVGWAGGHDAAALAERVLEHLGALPRREQPRQLPAPATPSLPIPVSRRLATGT